MDCLRWLIEEGSGNPHMMAADGMSPIHAAAQAGHIPCLAFLTSIDSSVRQPAEDGATPAHFAAASGQVETLEWILDHGGSAFDRDNLGGTPIHDAAEQGQAGTLSALIRRGVSTQQEDYEGLKPLDLAKDNQHSECVQLLFKTISPSLLTSITPRHSLTRASAVENDKQDQLKAEKQQQFESALMAGLSEETREAMWANAQQQAARAPQPGLKLLLENGVSSPSQLPSTQPPQPLQTPQPPQTTQSLQPPQPPQPPSPAPASIKSQRSAQHSSRRAPSSGKTPDMDITQYKPRPALSPSLFVGMAGEAAERLDEDEALQSLTKRVRTETEKLSGVEQKQAAMERKPAETKQKLAVARGPARKPSPIPQRAKFLRKFNVGGKKKQSPLVPTNLKGKGEMVTEPPKEVEKAQEVEGEQKMEEGREEGREDVTAGRESLQTSVETQPVKELKMAAMRAGSYTGGWAGSHSNGDRDSANPYDMVAEELVSGALRDSLMVIRGRDGTGMMPEVAPIVTITTAPSASTPPSSPAPSSPPPSSPPPSSPPPSSPPPSSPPPSSPPPSSPPPTLTLPPPTITENPDAVMMRLKKPKQKHVLVQEKAVIQKQKVRKSLKTPPDETITVNFVPRQSNVKKSFPVTHTRLLKDDDLSSPESTSEEDEKGRRSSTGFEKLNLKTFEEFGQDINDVDRQQWEREEGQGTQKDEMEMLKESKEDADVFQAERDRDEASAELREEKVDMAGLDILMPTLSKKERALSMGNIKPLQMPPLKKWDNISSLERIDKEGGESVQKKSERLGSVVEEDEDDQQQQHQQQHHEEEGGGERERRLDIDVLRRVSQIETEREERGTPHASPAKGGLEGVREGLEGAREGLAGVKSGSVSDKLRMFGGGRKVTRSVSDSRMMIPALPKPSVKQETILEEEAEVSGLQGEGEDREEEDEVTPLPKIQHRFSRQQSEEKLRLDGLPSPSPPRDRRGKDPFPPPISEPRGTRMSPPRIQGRSSSPPSLIRHMSHSPPLERVRETETSELGGVSPTNLRRRSSSGVYSPLVVSADASTAQLREKDGKGGEKEKTGVRVSVERPTSAGREAAENELETKRRSFRDERARRQLFALAADGNVGSRESAYMGWAQLPSQLGHMKQRWEKEAGEGIRRRVESLLRPPRLTGAQIPLEFRGLQPRELGRLTVWRQKAGSLQKVPLLDSIQFEDNGIYIFLKEPLHGPVLHHVYLWLGGGASELSVSSAHQHCQQLLHCLPGGPPLHRETQGHESGGFMSMLGVGVASRLPGCTPYVNSSLDSPTLYNLNSTFMSFQASLARPPSHADLLASPSPSLLDTHTRLWVWLPIGYWGNQTGSQHYQKSVLDIAQSFLTQKGYLKWAPVTVLTQHSETLQFTSHFSTWPDLNFDLAPPTWRPIVGNLQLLELTTPTTRYKPSDTKIYRMEGGERKPLPPVPSSHLSASGVYMFQWTLRHASPLYMWVETAVCVWVGSGVGDYWQAVAGCARHIEKETPLTLVPSGQEPPQLLSFFQGHLVIHQSSPRNSPLLPPHRVTSSTDHKKPRLYQVIGTSLEHIKAIEVPPKSSSLCSTHCYILTAPPHFFSWSGHFSSEDTRTGALYIAQIMNSSRKPLLVAEGQEGEEFWACLGGKGSYQHFDHGKFPAWSVPELYCCLPSQNYLSFTQLPPAKRKDLKSSGCYIMWLRNQLFVWVGSQWSQWRQHHFVTVVKAYLAQHCSGCSARDFVVMVVHEGHEGEDFWQWFDLQRCLEPNDVPQSPTQKVNKQEATPNNQQEVKHDGQQEATPTNQQAVKPGGQQEATPTSVDGADDGVGEVKDKGVQGGEEAPPSPLPPPPPPPVTTTGPATTEATTPDKPPVEPAQGEDPEMTTANGISSATAETVKEAGTGQQTSGSASEIPVTTATEQEEQTSSHVIVPTNQITASDSLDSIDVLSVSSLLTQPEDLEDAMSSKQKRRSKRASIRSPQSLVVAVEVEGGRVVEVTVREGAPVITVMFRVAEVAGLTLEPASSLFEIAPQLKLHRPLEEHELIREVLSQWPSKQRPQLLLRTFLSKSMLWGPTPPLPKPAIIAFLESGTVPVLSQQLSYSPRATKPQWRTGTFTLGENGIYITTKSGGLQMYAGLDHHVYTPAVIGGQSLTTPTKFCFAMKPVTSWKQKEVKLFCCSDLPTMAQWVHAIRLLKHGRQLKRNLVAMRQRLQKRDQKNAKSPPSS